MKVIDLLNKIANGEEVPKKIKWRDKIWTYNNKDQDYEINDTDLLGYGFCNHKTLDFINDEVEILEEKKIPEKINISNFPRRNNSLKKTAIRLNEIIDYLDYLKSKGE